MGDTALIFNIMARDKTSATFDKIKAGAAVAGVAIGAALVAAAGQAIEKSRLDNKVSAQLGATPDQAKAIGKLSGSVYAAGFGADMPEVSAAIKAAAQNGLVDVKNASSETSKAVVKNLLTVSTVLEEDTERTSAAISQMLRTGLAKTSEEAMDMLVTATQRGVNKSQDLLDTTNEYGTQFRKLGLDGTQAFGLISQAIQAGARDSDTAADALKEFSLLSIDGSAKAAAGYKALGLDAKKMTAQIAQGGPAASAGLQTVLERLRAIKDPVKQNAAAVGLFGTKAEDMGKALLSMDLNTATGEMKGMSGATGKAAATMQTGAAKLDAFKRQVEGALIEKLGQAVPYIEKTFGWMQRNQAWLTPVAVGLGVLAAAIGVVTAVQWAWNAALLVSPVTWIIIGIVALVAVIVLVATKTKFFQTIWGAVWGFLKGVGAWFAGPFAGFFVDSWRKIIASLNKAKSQFFTAVNFVKNLFLGWVKLNVTVTAKIIGGVMKVVNFVKSAPGKMASALRNMFAPLWGGFRGFVNKIIGGWNRLHFGIPGFSFAGMSVPGVSIGTPDIPYMATGGQITREGLFYGHAGETVTKAAEVARRGPGTGSGGGGGGTTIRIEGSNAKVIRVLLELLREGIRDQGGDVVKVLTPQ